MSSHGEYDCHICRGDKIIPQQIHLSHVCPSCNGNGTRDWISNARNEWGPTDREILQYVVMSNVQRLMQEILSQGQMIGVQFNIELKRNPNSYEEYMMYHKDIKFRGI